MRTHSSLLTRAGHCTATHLELDVVSIGHHGGARQVAQRLGRLCTYVCVSIRGGGLLRCQCQPNRAQSEIRSSLPFRHCTWRRNSYSMLLRSANESLLANLMTLVSLSAELTSMSSSIASSPPSFSCSWLSGACTSAKMLCGALRARGLFDFVFVSSKSIDPSHQPIDPTIRQSNHT